MSHLSRHWNRECDERMSRYRTIVADPPWDYGRDNERWASITHGGEGPRKETAIPYKPMSFWDLLALPVYELADPDCRLFLWTTNAHLPLAFRLMDAWDFEYRQTLVWRKTGNPSPFGGSIAPNHAEYLLIGTRGKPAVVDRVGSSVIEAPAAVFGHSVKPECFLDLAEQVSPGPYVELFARRERLGWDTWGDQSLGTATMPAA